METMVLSEGSKLGIVGFAIGIISLFGYMLMRQMFKQADAQQANHLAQVQSLTATFKESLKSIVDGISGQLVRIDTRLDRIDVRLTHLDPDGDDDLPRIARDRGETHVQVAAQDAGRQGV